MYDSFYSLALKLSSIAMHVTIKHKIQHLAKIKVLPRQDIDTCFSNVIASSVADFPDAALLLPR